MKEQNAIRLWLTRGVAVMFILIAQSSYAQPAWIHKSEPGGSFYTGFSIGGKGYILNFTSNEFKEFDPATNTWTLKASYPGQADTECTGFSIGAKGYVGLGSKLGVVKKDFWEYDPATNTWTQKADFGGTARRWAAGFSIGTKGYVGVGQGAASYADFWEYDPGTNVWTPKANFPFAGENWRGGFSINTKGYLSYNHELWEYSPVGNIWVRKADYPGDIAIPAFYVASNGFSIGNKGYMGLGVASANFYEYDQPSNTWTRVSDFPSRGESFYVENNSLAGRFNNVAFSIGGKGYVGGGNERTSAFGAAGFSSFWEFNPGNASTSCLVPEEGALLARIYDKMNGENWTNKWIGSNETSWFGVAIFGCHVTEIVLPENNLVGHLSTDLNELPSLNQLDLHGNNISNTVPSNMFTNARLLDLSRNSLTGVLPTAFGSTTISLNLGSNQLTGAIPLEIGTAAQLSLLDLSNNLLEGSIPPQIGNATQLQNVNFSNNKLTGTLPPQLGNLAFLQVLNLSDNKLSGTIPSAMGAAMTSLSALNLSNNNFSGSIPATIIQAGWLALDLDLSVNSFSGVLPVEFATRTFSKLNLKSNQLTSIPSLTALASSGPSTILDVRNNFLDFASIEPNYSLSISFGFTFLYDPQLDLARQIVQGVFGSPVTFSPPFTPTGTTTYQWFKNEVLIPGETSQVLSIGSMQPGDVGIYKLKVISSIINFPSLELEAEYLLVSGIGTGIIPPEEREALLWLYYSAGGSNWLSNSNWLNGDESTWYGINVINGHVTSIYLLFNNLAGFIPPELEGLDELTELHLDGLSGRIPPHLGKLNKLQYLELGSMLSGEIPSELGNLESLYGLTISNSLPTWDSRKITGDIPVSLGKLTNLFSLNLSNHRLSGSIPPVLGNLSNLTYLNLGFNTLSGTIPVELSNLTLLNNLSLGGNSLMGSIPVELSNLDDLQYLFLNSNGLSGTIPSELASMPTLYTLDLSYNQLSGSIPPEFGTSPALQELDLYNNQLTGSIPASLGNSDILRSIDASYNQLSGPIPPELGQMGNLAGLNFSANQLTGGLPVELSTLTNLRSLSLRRNMLTGPIPTEFGLLTNLYNLLLDNNQLNGSIPVELGLLTLLQNLDLSYNQLTGSIPVQLGNINPYFLVLSNNQLSGAVPTTIGNSTRLVYLALANNQFTGNFPAAIAGLSNLRYVYLNANQFTDIPTFLAPKFQLQVENNLLDFGDLRPNAGLGGFTYNPQATILSGGIVNSTIGCPLTIPFSTPGTSNLYQWYKDGTLIPGATSQAFALPAAYAADNGNYTVKVTNSVITGLQLFSANWVVTVGGTPLAPPTAPDVPGCINTSVPLVASGAVGPQQYRWYASATGGTSLASTSVYTTPVLSIPTSYFVSIFDPGGGCESPREEVIANIGGNSPTAIDGSQCGTLVAITIGASGGVDGDYRWYTVPTGGSPIPLEVHDTFTTPPISATTNYYVSIDNGTCESARVSVTATVSSLTSPSTTTPSPICDIGSTTLNASGGGSNQYRWYTLVSGGSAIPSETNASFNTPTISTTTSYFVSIDNGTCESSRIEIQVIVNPSPLPPTVTDGSGCSGTTIGLLASGGLPGAYRWYAAATGGTPIAGAVNGNFTTPMLTASTSYFVAVNDGCESMRSEVFAVTIPLPTAPSAPSPSPVCPGNATTITASGTSNGSYRWYDGTTLMPSEVNSQYTTPVLSVTKTYGVAIFDGTCESTITSVNATIQPCSPPVIATKVAAPFVPGIIRIDLTPLLSDPEGNLDLSTLMIIGSLPSGATATIVGTELVIDYTGIAFPGIETIELTVCDLTGLCATETLTLQLSSDIGIYNAVSPNGDGKNETFFIENIDKLPDTKENKVMIFNRWGDVIFEVENYDNAGKVFRGLNNIGESVPAGTYYYRIEFKSGAASRTGFISLKK